MASNAFNQVLDTNVVQLYSAAASMQSDGNLALSPLSILYATTLMYIGSSGATKSNLDKSLHFDQHYKSNPDSVLSAFSTSMANFTSFKGGQDEDLFTINLANGIFLRKGLAFTNKFKDSAISKLESEAQVKDFQSSPNVARQEINNWVSKKTDGRINDLLPQGAVTQDTVAVLANALYFKGTWGTNLKFEPEQTNKSDFVMLNGQKQQVDMMVNSWTLPYAEDDNLDIQYMEYSYTSGQGSMVFLLPRKKDGLRSLEKKLTAGVFDALHKKAVEKKVSVTLPKFRVESDFNLVELLKKIGIKDAFERSRADFSSMTALKGVYVGSGYHKTYVEIDEKGTEAAAASAVAMFEAAGFEEVEPPKEFKADHPFIFAIRHNPTDAILFIGRVEKF